MFNVLLDFILSSINDMHYTFSVAKPGLDVQTFSASIPYDLKKVRPIWIENPICPRNTISLEQCSADRKWGKINDYGYRDFGVTCLGEYIGGHIESGK